MGDNQYYEKLLMTLHNDLKEKNGNAPLEADDEKINNAAASQSKELDEEYNKRNGLYTELLKNYITRYNAKERMKAVYKGIFFGVIMVLFVAIVSCGLAGLILLSQHGNGGMENIGIAIADIAGIVSSLVVLPRIIAEHLFPVDEESNMIGMVRNMQENDANIRNIIYDKKKRKK